MSISKSTPTAIAQEDNRVAKETCTVYSVACDDSNGTRAQVFCLETDALRWLAENAEGPDEDARAELLQLADAAMTMRFGNSSSGPARTSLPTASNPTTCNSSPISFDFMNHFEFKRQQKAERFRELAEKHESISTGRHLAAREQLEMIPPGQPILVGHHSEKRHRAHLKRIDHHFAKAKEHHDKAEYFRRRAEAVESNRAIFSDDPNATEKLVDKIERLKKRQGVMKRANQLIRKADREGLCDLGFSDDAIEKLFQADWCGRIGFPDYALKNNSANIRRLEKRLAGLQKANTEETTEEEFAGGIRLIDNVEENRLQIFFPDIPAESVRRELKRNGFRWSPAAGAWQRHRSTRATYLAKLMLTNGKEASHV